MKTIAITMDEQTLDTVDRLVRRAGGAQNRSQMIRQAVQEHVARLERLADEEREAAIVRRHRGRLGLQAAALVREQAKP